MKVSNPVLTPCSLLGGAGDAAGTRRPLKECWRRVTVVAVLGVLMCGSPVLCAPSISRVTTVGGEAASAGAPGEELVVHGAGFGVEAGAVWLDRGGYGREAELLEWNQAAGQIRLRVPAGT